MESPIRTAVWTDEEIRRNIAWQESMTERLTEELGFTPDIEDWDEYDI